jgi:hypothetical protein
LFNAAPPVPKAQAEPAGEGKTEPSASSDEQVALLH